MGRLVMEAASYDMSREQSELEPRMWVVRIGRDYYIPKSGANTRKLH